MTTFPPRPHRLGTAVCTAALLCALSSPACSSDDPDASGGLGSGDGAFGNADGTGALAGGDGTAASGGGAAASGSLGAGDSCASGSIGRSLGVNMLVMFDRSGSMDDDGKWPNATAALNSFFQNPATAGLRVALRFFPHDSPASGCTRDGCDATACAEPLVPIDTLLADAAPADAHEAALVDAIANSGPNAGGGGGGGGRGGGTPIYAALDGALRWATAQKQSDPDTNTVVIFVTDGEPNGCDEDFDNISALASDALGGSDITTYAIGLEGSSEGQMDQLATAGGTGAGIFIGNSANAEQELLDALNAIRSETLSCDFRVPSPADSQLEVDLSRINVTFTDGAGTAATFRQVPDAAGCGTATGWYYDDPADPQRIFLCQPACDLVRDDPAARIEVLVGCATCGGLDETCGGQGSGPPPGIPPVYPD